MLRVHEIKLAIDEGIELIPDKIKKKFNFKRVELASYSIYKESIDARNKDDIKFVYSVDIEVSNEVEFLKNNGNGKVEVTPDMTYQYVQMGEHTIKGRPVIVGFGPCGMLAALILSEMGYKPIVVERGKSVEERAKDVQLFWQKGILNVDSNVQFGEGGAGTFSDGKLTTQIKDLRCRKVLEELVKAGAHEEILYKQKPHIGTDVLQNVVVNIRNRIVHLGGEIRFQSKLTDFQTVEGSLHSVIINDREKIETSALILAMGHSARDTFEMLWQNDMGIEQKPFSIGVRIEHPQEVINISQYGKNASHPRLGAADYKLSYRCKNGRGVYTFCMCPGGQVIASSSEEESIVTNGMSVHDRDGANANSALLVDVHAEDFDSQHPLAGMYFQRLWERKAWELTGTYRAPAQKVGDFLKGIPSVNGGTVVPSYTPAVMWSDFSKCLPEFAVEAMKEAIPELGKKLKGFNQEDAVMTGVETRSSSPIRIKRDETYQSNVRGIFPAGEGAGFAGGIVSAAVDGIKAAEAVAKIFFGDIMKVEKGYIQVYTGNGKGKTTAALGLTLRAVCAGKKVYFGQFMKGLEYSELRAVEMLDNFKIRQFGGVNFVCGEPGQQDIEDARRGLQKMKEVLSSGEYDIVVFDEINTVLYYKMVPVEEVLDILSSKPERTEVVLTGRYAPQEIIDKADLVTEMKEIKHYYDQGVEARVGIEK